jgi:hypothetical protein
LGVVADQQQLRSGPGGLVAQPVEIQGARQRRLIHDQQLAGAQLPLSL